ncbi:SIR2 family protein [Arthrobacter sp. Soil761]|uniref:SIR2 family protein n=1 Tax=Arthrobacter sp. Soil761 TaxID=1736400 RepID=UPI0009EA5DAC|nr:SIR2 family protein [Arthrobacter sp. Soil761]
MSIEPARTVPAVLEKFDSTFSEFSAGFNEGQYVFWLGSGISRERVPNVNDLLERVIEHLRSHIDPGDPECEYRIALDEVLRLTPLTREELESIDFSIGVSNWDLRKQILAALVTKYSSVLDVPVGDDSPEDYLVWTGLDVPDTYGAPDLEPDVEHYCIAILLLEGLVPTAVTANWDGLLEKALNELTPAFASLVRVVVKPDDFRDHGPRIDIIKFHGCAVRARDFQGEYRERLIARDSQISTWTTKQENRSMRKHLETLYTDRLTLMLGLSAQDANIHTMFANSIQDLSRPFPAAPPSVVLSEERLESYHRLLLKITFGENHQGNSKAIADSALLGAYAKPTLLALVLTSLTEKLSYLLEHSLEGVWEPASAQPLQTHLFELRDLAASLAQPDNFETLQFSEILEFQREFTARLIEVVNLALTIFRAGRTPDKTTKRYEPLSERPIAHAVLNPDYPSKQFGRLAIALALIGRGLSVGQWSVEPGHGKAPDGGVIRLLAGPKDARIFFVKDATALTGLELDGALDEGDASALVVVADEEPRTQTRSPRSRYGRDGKSGAGRFNVASSMCETSSVDELYEAFKLAGGF